MRLFIYPRHSQGWWQIRARLTQLCSDLHHACISLGKAAPALPMMRQGWRTLLHICDSLAAKVANDAGRWTASIFVIQVCECCSKNRCRYYTVLAAAASCSRVWMRWILGSMCGMNFFIGASGHKVHSTVRKPLDFLFNNLLACKFFDNTFFLWPGQRS